MTEPLAMRPLRIAVADDEPDVLEFYQVVLSELGHEVICSARDGRDLVEQCRATPPELVIIDVKMPRLDGLDAIRQISDGYAIPAIVVTGYHDVETIRRAEEDHILAYLIKPIREVDLQASIAIAMRQHEQSKALRSEVVDLQQTMDDQRTIARAMRVLKKQGLDEEQAAERLRKLARVQGRPLAEIARTVADVHEGLVDG